MGITPWVEATSSSRSYFLNFLKEICLFPVTENLLFKKYYLFRPFSSLTIIGIIFDSLYHIVEVFGIWMLRNFEEIFVNFRTTGTPKLLKFIQFFTFFGFAMCFQYLDFRNGWSSFNITQKTDLSRSFWTKLNLHRCSST